MLADLNFIKTSNKPKNNGGFTLIELLVVFSIISLLSSISLVSMNTARARARDVLRIENLKNLQTVIELYQANNGHYPKTFEPGDDPYGQTTCGGFMTNFIPEVVPNYIAVLPTDPTLDCAGKTHGWTYASDGIDFKLVTHAELGEGDPIFLDPAQDGGATGPGYCILDGFKKPHYGVWTAGAQCWPI
ncbi:MAG: prepilin-type N-terminal cleavage/methylation domain-containing protein [Candidatus Doudnabacteria bacterium]|nr:prepilin-type N-terminal cleavage/methylation domain-containing protein [Candidatus Doudnabacteria bacterium]